MIRKSLSQDFESLFKDTELNISSIKKTLGEHKKRESFNFPPRSPVHGNYLDSYNTLKSPNFNNNTFSPPPPAGSSQTTLITSMFNRLEEQSKSINLLEKTVRKQNDEIQKLKMKQHGGHQHLGKRSDTNKENNAAIAVDFQSKLLRIERELRAEIDDLSKAIKNSSNLSSPRNNNIDLLGDIKYQKRMIENETNSLKRELDSFKNRIERVESDVNVSVRDTRSINRRYGDIEKDVTEIFTTQKNLKDVTVRGEDQLINIRKELEEISTTLTSMQKESEKTLNDSKNKNKSSVNVPKKGTPDLDDIANSPSHSFSTVRLTDHDDSNNTLNSLELSDIVNTEEDISPEKSQGLMRHTSILVDDDEDVPDFNSCLEDESLFKHSKADDSFKEFKLSDEEDSDNDMLGDLLHDDFSCNESFS